jgi:hypothetical protein
MAGYVNIAEQAIEDMMDQPVPEDDLSIHDAKVEAHVRKSIAKEIRRMRPAWSQTYDGKWLVGREMAARIAEGQRMTDPTPEPRPASHDPLCAEYGNGGWIPGVGDCLCDLIARVRADERERVKKDGAALMRALLRDQRTALWQQSAREFIEIIHSATLPRLIDDDGTDYVARVPLIAELRAHAMRRIHASRPA